MSSLIELTPLQKTFLTDLVQKNTPVAIYLKNGIRLKGTLKGFDEYCFFLDHPCQQIVYRNLVSTIAPLLIFETFGA